MKSKRCLDVLVVDDEPDGIEVLVQALHEDPHIRAQIFTDFKEAESRLAEVAPDIVVVDLVRAGDEMRAGDDVLTDEDLPGVGLSERAWENGVFPMLIYTAEHTAYKPPAGSDAFIRVIPKGRDSEDEVMAAISDYRPYVEVLRSAQERARRDMVRCIRDAYPPLWKHDNVGKSVDALMRAARRRFAAMLDETKPEDPLPPWEQYLCPPVSNDLLTGDLLREREGKPEDAEAFRVVLSPSCDMALTERAGNTKVARVLVAKCASFGSSSAETRKLSLRKLRDRLPQMLNQGHLDTVLPLPQLPGRIPVMVAEFRDLDLLDYDSIGRQEEKKPFVRVASVDSPFRELVAWAYTRVAGRPGLPVRHTKAWAEEIIVALEKAEASVK